MGLLSSSVSVTRYKVKGNLEKPVLEKIYNGLIQNAIPEIDDDHLEKIVGWTSFENPYVPDFEDSSFVIGPYLVFSMRLDKKSIPPKIIQKHYAIEMARQLEKSGRQYLSRNEKKSIKDHVIDVLNLRIPATPNIYDLIWNMEESWLWFFSNLKAANEELETLFLKSFKLSLIRLFPYTTADLMFGLSDADQDLLLQLSPTQFTE
ncbi:MAG: recombination-associated protein RdgC [Desulfobacteraceae bacterium]|nr:recombination-associated protein RdgC [Desulfobacteraceae bacterium]MBC2718486.1 recombination-associated protein RdgC [Desulfobacteraceae bacterium]